MTSKDARFWDYVRRVEDLRAAAERPVMLGDEFGAKYDGGAVVVQRHVQRAVGVPNGHRVHLAVQRDVGGGVGTGVTTGQVAGE